MRRPRLNGHGAARRSRRGGGALRSRSHVGRRAVIRCSAGHGRSPHV